SEILVDGVFQTSFGDLIAEDIVSIPQDIQFFLGDFTDYADCKARTGERLAHDQIFRQLQLTAQLTNLVFEQQSERFNDFLKVNIVRKTADVMMALDDSSITGTRFDNVRIDGTLY